MYVGYSAGGREDVCRVQWGREGGREDVCRVLWVLTTERGL